jgi:hypothetical protein
MKDILSRSAIVIGNWQARQYQFTTRKIGAAILGLIDVAARNICAVWNAAIKVGLNDKPTNPMVKAKKLIL